MSEKTIVEPTEGPAVRHERSDVDSKGVVTFVGVLAAALILVGVLLYFFFFFSLEQENQKKKSQYPLAIRTQGKLSLPPSPRLEGVSIDAPEHDVGRLRPSSARIMTEQEDRVLQNGGPAADEKGFTRRPIAEVLAELAGKLPVRSGPAVDARDEFLREPGVTSSGRSPRGGKSPEAKGDMP
jgi:hypothetical protein